MWTLPGYGDHVEERSPVSGSMAFILSRQVRQVKYVKGTRRRLTREARALALGRR